MSARFFALFLCLGALSVLATPSMGQTQAGADPVADLSKRVDALETKMATKADVDSLREDVKKLLDAIEAQRQAPQPGREAAGAEKVAPEAKASSSQVVTHAEFDPVKRAVDDNTALIAQNRIILEQVAQNIAGQDLYVPNIRGAMAQSPQFREDMKEAVRSSMGQQGELVIRNKTATGRSLRIRATGLDQTIYIPAMQAATVRVPVGTVTTELIGQEAPKNWMLGPPNDRQEIDILPAASPQVVYYEPAVYYETPLWLP